MGLYRKETVFCLELSNSISYKKKKNLIELITSNGGKVSFILNKKVDYLVRDERTNTDTYKTRTAFKLGITVLHVDFIYDWINEANIQLIDLNKYIIENTENAESLKKGRITKVEKKSGTKKTIDLSKLKVYREDNTEPGLFDDENYIIVKWIVFQKINEDHSVVIELHTSKSVNSRYGYRARIEKRVNSVISVEYLFAEDGSTLNQIYQHFASKYLDEKQYKHTRQLPTATSGSKMLQEIAWKSAIEQTKNVDGSVLEFVEYIWQESIGNLEDLFGIQLNAENISKLNLTIETLNKAECILTKQKSELKEGGKKDFSDEFHAILKLHDKHKIPLTDKRCLAQRFEICQVLRDIVSVNEATNWNLRASTISKYRSIGTHIKKIDENSSEYLNIKKSV